MDAGGDGVGDGACARAVDGPSRQQRRLRMFLLQILDDGQRLSQSDAFVDEDGNLGAAE